MGRADGLDQRLIEATPVDLAPPATRHVAAGGWRRAVIGTAVGTAAALALLRAMPAPTPTARMARAAGGRDPGRG